MTRRSRWSAISLALLVVMALSWSTVTAADKTKVDEASRHVEQGARQIGQGNVGSGLKEMFSGVGRTIFEGAKFSGNTVGDFFKKAFSS